MFLLFKQKKNCDFNNDKNYVGKRLSDIWRPQAEILLFNFFFFRKLWWWKEIFQEEKPRFFRQYFCNIYISNFDVVVLIISTLSIIFLNKKKTWINLSNAFVPIYLWYIYIWKKKKNNLFLKSMQIISSNKQLSIWF